MALPALHISLGTFLKFFLILETKCYEIDFKVAGMTGNGNGLSLEQIKSMSASFKEIRTLDEEIENVEHTVTLVHNAVAENISKNPDDAEKIQNLYEPRLIHLTNLIKQKVIASNSY